MVTIKASQKIFTYTDVANLIGICADHLHGFAKRHRLGFIARATETNSNEAEQWPFTRWDLMVLVSLFTTPYALDWGTASQRRDCPAPIVRGTTSAEVLPNLVCLQLFTFRWERRNQRQRPSSSIQLISYTSSSSSLVCSW